MSPASGRSGIGCFLEGRCPQRPVAAVLGVSWRDDVLSVRPQLVYDGHRGL